jgi:hypothetical protein
MAPHVNCKAEKLWSLWTTGGPPDGWFDSESCQNQFECASTEKKQEKEMHIGDNLSTI